MFAVIKDAPGRGISHITDHDVPTPGPHEVLLKVRKAAICGTDHHIYAWDAWSQARIKTPQVLGHELVGDIVECGARVSHLAVGQRVSVESHTVCHHCYQCRMGQSHVCTNTVIIGVDRPGGFAEYVSVPAHNVWPIADPIPDAHAALYDPAGNAMHTLQPLAVAGKDVLITGAGGIGLFAIAMARALGARSVGVVEPGTQRRSLAAKLGADYVLESSEEAIVQAIKDQTDGHGPDVVAEMSGAAAALKLALDVTRPGGAISLLGLFTSAINVDVSHAIIGKGLTLFGINGRRLFDTWRLVDAFMLRAPDSLDVIVTHTLPARAYQQGFDMMDSGACGRVVLDFNAP